MALYQRPDKIMGGTVFENPHNMSWAWQCPHCGDNMQFPMQLHPQQDPKMEVMRIIGPHVQKCESLSAKLQQINIAQQQIGQNLMSSFGVPGLSQHYGGLGGLSNGNRQAAQAAYSNTNSAASNANAGALASIVAQLRTYEESPKPLKRAGLTVGEIIGWRMWSLKDDYLWSYSRDVLWAPDEPMKGKPGDYDDAGVWAFKDKHRAIKKMLVDHYHSDRPTVFGSIAMWGTVIEHEDGYRAEYATIKSIDDAANIGKRSAKEKESFLQCIRDKYNLTGGSK